jgi:tumor protein p53-inducible protein 3
LKAVCLYGHGGADQLYLGQAQTPSPKEGELLVRVVVSALNRADILQREGKYPPPAGSSEILGLELAGTVEAVGAGVQGWKTGDRVFGLVPGGGQAEYAVIHADMALRMPPNFTFEQCAAIPEVFLTAFQSLIWQGALQAGERVLIHAGASGVGTAAIQLARCLGAEVFVTASPSKHDACLRLGAKAAVDYKAPLFWDELKTITNGVDLIVDPVGGSYFAGNIKLMNTDGRLVMLATMGGNTAKEVSIGPIVFKRLQIIGSTLRSRAQSYQVALVRDFWNSFESQFLSGAVVPVIDRVFEFKHIRQAHEYLESNASIGKVLLKIAEK